MAGNSPNQCIFNFKVYDNESKLTNFSDHALEKVPILCRVGFCNFCVFNFLKVLLIEVIQ